LISMVSWPVPRSSIDQAWGVRKRSTQKSHEVTSDRRESQSPELRASRRPAQARARSRRPPAGAACRSRSAQPRGERGLVVRKGYARTAGGGTSRDRSGRRLSPCGSRRRNRLLRARHRRGFDSAAVGNRSTDSRRLSSVCTLSTSASRPPSESASVMERYTRSIARVMTSGGRVSTSSPIPRLRRSPRSPEPTGSRREPSPTPAA
jgi:hypothetical protein